jgi:hypothetical protein
MSKKYTAAETKTILKEVCDRTYSMIALCHRELAKLDLTPEEMMSTDRTNPRVNQARHLSSFIVVLSDILSPAFKISSQLCAEDNQPFIKQTIDKYELYVKADQERKAQAQKAEEEFKVVMEGEGDKLP